jgi:hypothetical protein
MAQFFAPEFVTKKGTIQTLPKNPIRQYPITVKELRHYESFGTRIADYESVFVKNAD